MPSGPCDLHMLDMLGLIKFWLILGLILGLLFYLLHLASLVTREDLVYYWHFSVCVPDKLTLKI